MDDRRPADCRVLQNKYSIRTINYQNVMANNHTPWNYKTTHSKKNCQSTSNIQPSDLPINSDQSLLQSLKLWGQGVLVGSKLLDRWDLHFSQHLPTILSPPQSCNLPWISRTMLVKNTSTLTHDCCVNLLWISLHYVKQHWNIFPDFGPLLVPFHREVHHPHLFSFLTGTVVTLAFAEPWMRCLDFDKCATPFRSLGSNQADVYQFPMSSTYQFLRQPLFLDMHKHFCEPQLSRTASKPTLASVFPFWCVLCTIC